VGWGIEELAKNLPVRLGHGIRARGTPEVMGLSDSLRRSRTEPAAFTDVYADLSRGVLVFFARRTFDVEVARDLTAETFAQAFEHRRRYRGSTDEQATGWLFGIARNQLGHYVRRGVVARRSVQRLGIRVPEVAEDDYERIVQLAGLAELRERMAVAFDDLSPDQRDALRLRVVDERSYDEVAAALGVSEQTARARVSRALRRLADAVEMNVPAEVTR
jgi:RNA polymerase sigma-70 factor (ECF subfamily)